MNRRIHLLSAVAAGALLLAACGSSSGSDGATATTAAKGGAVTTTTAASSSSAAKAKDNDKLGSILANSKGLTLYTLTSGGKAVACSAACLGAWPAATVPAGTTGKVGGVTLGTAKATDGSTILTADGQPVYTFVKDEDDEDAYGEGITSFGGTWHVVKSAAGVSTAKAPASTTTAAASSGGGY